MKKSLQKVKLLYVKDYIEHHADNQHGVSVKQIQKYLTDMGQEDVDRKTIYDDINTLISYGMAIEHEANEKYYFLTNRTFELSEVKTLIDSVLSNKFLSEAESLEIITKLEKLCTEDARKDLRREVRVFNRVKSSKNESVLKNVDWLHLAIANDMQVSFRYFDYDVRKQKHYFYKGEKIVVSPWQLIYTNDNYYLLAFDSKSGKFKHFRADHMDRVMTVSNSEREGKKEFEALDMTAYTKYTFSMFGGTMKDVTMVFQNRMVGAVMDRFGQEVWLSKVDANHFQTTVPVSVSNQFFGWVLGLGKMVEITGPEDVRQDFIKYLKEISERYEE